MVGRTKDSILSKSTRIPESVHIESSSLLSKRRRIYPKTILRKPYPDFRFSSLSNFLRDEVPSLIPDDFLFLFRRLRTTVEFWPRQAVNLSNRILIGF